MATLFWTAGRHAARTRGHRPSIDPFGGSPAMPHRWVVRAAFLLPALTGFHGVGGAREVATTAAAMEGIRGDEARPHVAALADDTFEGREAGSRGGLGAAHYIAGAIAPLRLLPAGDGGSHFQRFDGMRNILALLPGSDPAVADELIVVGGHYDHVGYGSTATSNGPTGLVHNGADDNASGAAGLIEIAAALAEMPRSPRRSILLAWWDGEEKGLLGSMHFLRARPARLAGLRPVFCLNLDMIGRLRAGRVEVYGCRTGTGLRSLLTGANSRTALELIFDWELIDDSDHYPFIAAGIPAVMLHTGLHPQYHHPDDDAPLVDADGLAVVTRMALATLLDVADREIAPPRFRPQCRAESASGRQRLESAREVAIGRPPVGRFRPWGIATRDDPAEPAAPVIVAVTPGAPMEVAGVRAADRLVEIEGQPIVSHDDLLRRLRTAEATIDIVVERNGRLTRARVSR